MKIAYDASGLTPPRTGVGTYIQHLLTHLLRLDQINAYWIFAHRHLPEASVRGENGNSQWSHSYFPNRLVWMQCVLPLALRALRPDVVHFTNFLTPLAARAKMIVTLHDVVLLESPQWCSPRQRVLMRPLLKPSVRRAHTIITVSEQSKRDIVRLYQLAPERVHVIYEAAAPNLAQPLEATHARHLLAQYGWDQDARNLLYVGTLEPRKNLERLVSALARLHQRGLRAHLWLVGQRGWQWARLKRCVAAFDLDAFVHFTGYVPSAHLRAFYQCCALFVLPSLYEGFGLPAIEAMTCGAVVAVSDTPALREVTGDAAMHFVPTDNEHITECLAQLLTDHELGAELRARARLRAQQFSWERAAQQTLQVYQAAVK